MDALGHTAGADATCTTDQTCTVCGDVLKEASGHTTVVDSAKAPTCTENGLTEGAHCSICGEVFTAQQVVPANGHGHKAVVTDPTCTTKGYTTYTCHCGDTYIDNYVDATGHTEVVDQAVTATCTENGLTEGKHCSVCNVVLIKQQTISAKGHTPGEEATCAAPQTCTVCGAELAAALPHVWQEVPAKIPGRTENGYKAYETCEECGAINGQIEILPAIGAAVVLISRGTFDTR